MVDDFGQANHTFSLRFCSIQNVMYELNHFVCAQNILYANKPPFTWTRTKPFHMYTKGCCTHTNILSLCVLCDSYNTIRALEVIFPVSIACECYNELITR